MRKALQTLLARLEAAFNNLAVQWAKPFHADGIWIADIWRDDYLLVAQYSAQRGFGISAGSEPTSERPDETYPEIEDAYKRIFELLTSNARTIRHVDLCEFRKPLTQTQIASNLGVKQPTYARIEANGLPSMKIGTLVKVVAARHCELYILVKDADGNFFQLGDAADLQARGNAHAHVAVRAMGLFAASNTTAANAESSWQALKKKLPRASAGKRA